MNPLESLMRRVMIMRIDWPSPLAWKAGFSFVMFETVYWLLFVKLWGWSTIPVWIASWTFFAYFVHYIIQGVQEASA